MLILEPKIVQDKIKKVSGFLCRKMLWCREWTREKCLQSKEIIDKMKVVSTNYSQLLRSYEILPCPKPPKTASGTEVVNGVVVPCLLVFVVGNVFNPSNFYIFFLLTTQIQ